MKKLNILALCFILFACNKKKQVEIIEIVTISKAYLEASYSENSMDYDGEVYVDEWKEPASDTYYVYAVNGNCVRGCNNSYISNGIYRAKYPPQYDIDKADLDFVNKWKDLEILLHVKVDNEYKEYYVEEENYKYFLNRIGKTDSVKITLGNYIQPLK